MSDDNIIKFPGFKEKPDDLEGVDRVMRDVEEMRDTGKCTSPHGMYTAKAAKMIFDILARDVDAYGHQSGLQFYSFDLKNVLYQAIGLIKDYEKQ